MPQLVDEYPHDSLIAQGIEPLWIERHDPRLLAVRLVLALVPFDGLIAQGTGIPYGLICLEQDTECPEFVPPTG
jgi:hypothetical protein